MDQRLPCLFCEKTYLNSDTIIKHCARDHAPELNSADAIFGHVCPDCGQEFIQLSGHAARTHGRQLAVLFAEAREKDPHGVVQDRLRNYATLVQVRLALMLARGPKA